MAGRLLLQRALLDCPTRAPSRLACAPGSQLLGLQGIKPGLLLACVPEGSSTGTGTQEGTGARNWGPAPSWVSWPPSAPAQSVCGLQAGAVATRAARGARGWDGGPRRASAGGGEEKLARRGEVTSPD